MRGPRGDVRTTHPQLDGKPLSCPGCLLGSSGGAETGEGLESADFLGALSASFQQQATPVLPLTLY